MKYVMASKSFRLSLIISISLCAWMSSNAQQLGRKPIRQNTIEILPNREYDARMFLSETQKIEFKRLYQDFDKPQARKNWEWTDVDPLGLFSPEENRRRRRELFLFEYTYSAKNPSDREPTSEQLAFRTLLENQFEGAEILMSDVTVKISTTYTKLYEQKTLPTRKLLEKVAQLGLQWAQVGGSNLYLYNGTILLAKYKSGHVSLANLDVDRPTMRAR